jgi:hypothetical protein
MTRLENWSVYSGALVGEVYDHPDQPDGTNIIVKIKKLDLDRNLALTRNRLYKLGEPAVNSETICAKPDMDSFAEGDEVA